GSGGVLPGAPGRIRTRDPLLRRQLLYPAELQAPNDDCAGYRSRQGHAPGTTVIKARAGGDPHAPCIPVRLRGRRERPRRQRHDPALPCGHIPHAALASPGPGTAVRHPGPGRPDRGSRDGSPDGAHTWLVVYHGAAARHDEGATKRRPLLSTATWRRAVPEEVPMHRPPIPHAKSEDPEIAELIHAEARRQFEKIRLIPSENYVSTAVLEASGSVLTNKYSEGYPGRRYYEGQQFIDQIETLA